MQMRTAIGSVLLLLVAGVGTVFTQPQALADSPQSATPQADNRPIVAATVGKMSIYVAEVEQAIDKLLGNRDLSPERLQRIRAEMLEQLVRQRIVLHHLQREELAASEHQLAAELKRLTAKLKARDTTLKAIAAQRGITEKAFREDLHWRLSWQKHLGNKITDESLQQHFDKHRPHFDGTRVRISQILLVRKESAKIADLTQRVTTLREHIERSETTFAETAQEFSESPSKSSGGDLGFITRHGEMHESVAAAAFALKKGQMSPPVVSPHGVHLLLCTEIETGKGTWLEAREELRRAMTHEIFNSIVAAERPQVTVRYSKTMPYIDPEDGQLIVPKAVRQQ